MTLKNMICTLVGVSGGVIANLFGGWSGTLTTLLIFMALDYITGLIVAGVFKASKKSVSGGLDSHEGWKGLIKKGVTFAIVIVAYRLDLLIGSDYIKNAVIIAFCVNELISLIENAGLMGIPVPDVIMKAIEILKEESDKDEHN